VVAAAKWCDGRLNGLRSCGRTEVGSDPELALIFFKKSHLGNAEETGKHLASNANSITRRTHLCARFVRSKVVSERTRSGSTVIGKIHIQAKPMRCRCRTSSSFLGFATIQGIKRK
jgi:hypothetical protein